MRFFCFIFRFLCFFYDKKQEKIKKNKKKCEKICIYQKKVLPLHQILKTTPKRNPKKETKL